MAKLPRSAHEAFQHITPRLVEISAAVSELPVRKRLELSNMLVGYFVGLASANRHGDLHLLQAADNDIAS